MIATAAYILAKAIDEDDEGSAADLLDIAMFMAFDLAMTTAIVAPEYWTGVIAG